MRKSLYIPLLLPIIGLGLLQGVYWYQVKIKVDELADRLSPVAELRYDTIIADFDGSVGIEGVVASLVSGGELQLERAVLKLDSWTRVLAASDEMLSANWPENLDLALNGVRYTGSVNRDSEQLAALAPLGCQIPRTRLVEYLQALGLDDALVDVHFRYRLNPETDYINLDAIIRLPRLVSVETKAVLASPAQEGSTEQRASGLQFSELSIAIHDDSLAQRLTNYCAGLNDEQPVVFVNRHVAILSQKLSENGFDVSVSLLDGYRDFWLSPRGDAKLQLIAQEPLPLSALSAARYADDFKLLAAINGKRIQQPQLSWAPVTPMEEVGELLKVANAGGVLQDDGAADRASVVASESENTAVGGEVVTPPAAYPRSRPRNADRPVYEPVETGELVDHIGAYLQVDTLNGHRIEGQLESLPRGQMRILQKLEGGVALLPIRLELVRSIKVRR